MGPQEALKKTTCLVAVLQPSLELIQAAVGDELGDAGDGAADAPVPHHDLQGGNQGPPEKWKRGPGPGSGVWDSKKKRGPGPLSLYPHPPPTGPRCLETTHGSAQTTC